MIFEFIVIQLSVVSFNLYYTFIVKKLSNIELNKHDFKLAETHYMQNFMQKV